MNQNTLKKVIQWIAEHGIDAYCKKTIRHDLQIDEEFNLNGAHDVIRIILIDALNSAIRETGIETAKNPDELFDVVLTFLEQLNDYKPAFQKLFSRNTINLEYVKLAFVYDEITQIIFKPNIETFFDTVTYNIIMVNILYTWINDDTPDLSTVSNTINYITTQIFNKN